MHPMIQLENARADAEERLRRAYRHRQIPARPEPPPVRRRAAHMAGRLASRLDADTARRAVA